jgi:hypothetical protein
LLLEDEEFAWLRSLSAMIAQIDEALDGDEPVSTAAVDAFVGETYRLLRAGAGGAFETKYREALQRSPEVVMAHADVMKVLPPPKERAS